ncbi:MAG: methionine--tRNA ligase [candidate division Zixibacteria bacterium]|nr:methionine--tRNA ligase [candidate division Zixibacteria bacterium]
MLKNFYITTPIYYVNDKPHIGHAYTSIAADYFTRFHRLAGRESFFLTGTDEHGSKIDESAKAIGKPTQVFCDEVVEHFKDTWKVLGLQNDYFVRTTDKRHIKAVEKFLMILKGAKTPDGQDVIYEGVYEGMYCTGCEKFLTETEIDNGNCPIHKRPATSLKERNYFFRLKPYLPILREMIEKNELVILPEERRKEVLGLLKLDLPDFSISRETVKWGIPLPFDPSQIAYVWVDALPNYISAIGFGDDDKQFEKWWANAEVVHLMAKEILKFHTIFWPAMLMAADIKLPDKIFLHGFFTINGEKMGKSAGNMIDPKKMVEIYGPDATRYLLLNQYPFGVDGDVKEKDFVTRYNSDLANDLGNLVSRVAKMINQYCGGIVPKPHSGVPGQKDMMDTAEDLVDQVYNYVCQLKITDAIKTSLNLIRVTNKFIDNAAPWKLAKEGKNDIVEGALYTASELIRISSILLYPIMPEKMREVRTVFGLDDSTLTLDSARTWFDLPTGNKISLAQSVFPRLDAKKVPALVKQKDASPSEDGTGLITIDDVGKVELRVAEVLQAEKVEKADKLLKLQIDIGKDKRQIIAGVAEFYQPDELVGKKIIVVANLKPAKIRGVESNGMLLAAKVKGQLKLVTVDGDIAPGASVG